MKKFAITALAAAAAMAAAAPAAAQSYGRDWDRDGRYEGRYEARDWDRDGRYEGRYEGRAYDRWEYRHDWNRGFNVNRMQRQLDRRIDRGIQRGLLTRQEAHVMREQFRDIARLEARYRRDGVLRPHERNELERRLVAFERRLDNNLRDGQYYAYGRR